MPSRPPSLGSFAWRGCCICELQFESARRDRSIEPEYGIYTAEELIAKARSEQKWRCLYRMFLYDTRTEACQISGVSYHGHKCREPVVPLDPEKGLVKKASTKVSGTVTPAALGTMPFYWEEMVEGSIYGYPIHARCWELLSEHSLGAFVQTDPKGLFYFLCRAMEKCQDGMFQREDTNLYCHEGEDEKGAELVRTQIRRAQRRTKKRFQRGKVKCETRLARLPLEVLSMIGMYLPAKDARAVQDVTRLYLGDAYWRQQIPWRMFPEIREIQKKKLDWEFLYQELERLRLDPKKLVTRKCIMRRLDWYLKYHKHIEMTRRLWGSDYNSEDEVYDECSRYD